MKRIHDLHSRPRWFSPGMIFLRFLAKSLHLQMLTEDEYKKLMTEVPVALKALHGNTLNSGESPVIKGIVSFVSRILFACISDLSFYQMIFILLLIISVGILVWVSRNDRRSLLRGFQRFNKQIIRSCFNS